MSASGSTRRRTPASTRSGRRSRHTWRWWLRRSTYAAILVGVALVGGVFALMNTIRLPDPKSPPETSFICLADVASGKCGPGNAVASLSADQNRVALRYDQMSPLIIQAVVSAEDRDFFNHNGIDPVGIARALFRDVVAGSDSTQGGSTITQQYVKQEFLTTERSFTRKLREAALAMKLERKLTKRQILERYLNAIYFGRGAYGIEAAARAYFDVSAHDVTLDQAAFLAGLIRAPNLADPVKNPKEATRRRRTVLEAMVETGYITRQQADSAGAVPWKDHVVDTPLKKSNVRVIDPAFDDAGGGYIAEWVRQKIGQRFGEGAAYTKGLRIYLTIDRNDQVAAQQAVKKQFTDPADPAGALVSIDESGKILAFIGGQNYDISQVNLALGTSGGGSGRQPGSTFKPFALAAFVEQGNSTQSVFNAPQQLVLPHADEGKDWTIDNYEPGDLGTITVENATWSSVNTVFAQIMQKVGAKAVVDVAKRAGVTAPMRAVNSIVLGTKEVSVLDMATAYSTFSNHGVLKQPYVISRVENAAGQVLFQAPTPVQNQALSPDVADTVTNVLRGVITKGTGTHALLKVPAVGKTGTTTDHKDAWFVGYTCHVTTAVWVGYPIPAPMVNVHGVAEVAGGTFPAAIWHDYMTTATQGQSKCNFRSVDAGTNKVNPDLVVGPPTSSTTTTVPGATTVAPPAAGGAATTTAKPAPPAGVTTTAAPAAPPP